MTDSDEPRCPSCGKPFTEHPGLIPTCRELTALRQRIDNAIIAAKSVNQYTAVHWLEGLLKGTP